MVDVFFALFWSVHCRIPFIFFAQYRTFKGNKKNPTHLNVCVCGPCDPRRRLLLSEFLRRRPLGRRLPAAPGGPWPGPGPDASPWPCCPGCSSRWLRWLSGCRSSPLPQRPSAPTRCRRGRWSTCWCVSLHVFSSPAVASQPEGRRGRERCSVGVDVEMKLEKQRVMDKVSGPSKHINLRHTNK